MIYPYKERCTMYSIYDWEHEVEVYRNLHNGRLSIRCSKSKLVLAHADAVCLLDVKFIVRQKGREKVLEEGRKNVHSVARGKISMIHKPSFTLVGSAMYNPYKHPYFYDIQTEQPVYSAYMAYIQPRLITLYETRGE